jgi:hypothetical protein
MKLLRVEKSNKSGKKYMAIFDNNGRTKTTHFGLVGANDFTLTGDVKARDRYWQRHQKDLKTNDPTRAGYLSLFLLWNLTTLEASIRDYKRRFGL